jgi:hypothetical protein
VRGSSFSREEKISFTRKWAPPLWEIRQAHPKGARIRQVSRRAIEYTRAAGFELGEVYFGVESRGGAGVPARPAARPWRWGLPALGLVLGALVGPVGAVIGGLVGGVLAVRGA